MGRMVPFPIVGGAYADDSLPWSHQETVNYLPVLAEKPGTRSPSKLAMVPGMRVFADIGAGPYRGSRDVEGKRFVVSGPKLYQVAVDGVATELGTIPGTGRVCMTHNQISGGNQVVIGNGSSGYVWNTYTSTFAQITDDAFPGMKSCDFLNQYILGVEPFGRYWFHSALVDATDYNALDEYQAETSPDRIMGLIALHNEVLAFGSRSIEPWTNVPTENQAFQLQRGSVIESGCASGNTICKLDNSVFYLTENGQIARLNGYTPQIVSTYAMEGAIRGCDLSRAFAFTWEDKGHTVYYITFPEIGTFGWDVRQGEWHRRKSFGIDRWRLNTLFKSGNDWFGGDYQNGKLYKLDWDYALDGCEPIERKRVAGVIHDNGNRLTVNAFEVRMDAGASESVKHGGITISGNMPDAYVGDTIDFTYTITRSYPGQEAPLQVTGLPDGLSIDNDGHVTGTLTSAGTFNVEMTAVDDCGNEAAHSDAVVVAETVMGAQQTWHYLQTTEGDAADYSPPEFDDSAWPTGPAPFGEWQSGEATFSNPPLFDARFSATFATNWDVYTTLWLRRRFTLTSIPEAPLQVASYMDDHYLFYVNGDLLVTSSSGLPGGGGASFAIDSSSLVVGENVVAIRCNDEPNTGGVSVVYADFIIEVAP